MKKLNSDKTVENGMNTLGLVTSSAPDVIKLFTTVIYNCL
jgi:hypothetical protein